MTPSARIAELGLTLPEVSAPVFQVDLLKDTFHVLRCICVYSAAYIGGFYDIQ